jgi:hypothetical protein
MAVFGGYRIPRNVTLVTAGLGLARTKTDGCLTVRRRIRWTKVELNSR